jgi:hypothetical protein
MQAHICVIWEDCSCRLRSKGPSGTGTSAAHGRRSTLHQVHSLIGSVLAVASREPLSSYSLLAVLRHCVPLLCAYLVRTAAVLILSALHTSAQGWRRSGDLFWHRSSGSRPHPNASLLARVGGAAAGFLGEAAMACAAAEQKRRLGRPCCRQPSHRRTCCRMEGCAELLRPRLLWLGNDPGRHSVLDCLAAEQHRQW